MAASLLWLRRTLAWSNTRQAWQERASVVAAAAGAMLLWHWGERLSAAFLTALWGAHLLATAFLLRRGWLRLFGPVLFYELVRVARRRRYFLLRGLYALVLAGVFLWLYLLWTVSPGVGNTLSPREMAALAEAFFSGFMLVQFVIVTLLVPVLTGGAVAEEKESKTLEFLLATDLRNREIVLSKLAARLANVTLIVLTGLPILSLIQFFGGIDPDLLLASFSALGLTVLSLTCLGILFSVLMKRSRDAILLTYLTVAAYLTLASIAFGLPFWFPTLRAVPIWFVDAAPTVADLVEWFNAGNLFVLIYKAIEAVWGNAALSTVLPGLLGEYFVFHTLVAVVCGAVAVLRLRRVALKQASGQARATAAGLPLWRRRRLRHSPLLWKELCIEGGVRFGWIGRIVLTLLVLASLFPAVMMLAEFVEYYRPRSNLLQSFGDTYSPLGWLQEDMNLWARCTGSAVACLMLIGVAVRAAGGLAGERSRQTLDSLLTTPLESSAILGAKLLGSILCVRWGWLWLVTIWLLTLPVDAVHFLALPLVLVAWLVYAAGCATLGLWFSLVCRTTLRASVWTLTTLFALTAGQWLVSWLFVYLPLEILASASAEVDLLVRYQLGQTLPIALYVFAFRLEEFFTGYQFLDVFTSALVGLVFWALGALVLWTRVLRRFRSSSGRSVPGTGSRAQRTVAPSVPIISTTPQTAKGALS